jgi:hypothetical protein
MATNPCKGIEGMVNMIVGRLHVGAPDEEAADYVVSRLKGGGKGIDPKIIRQVRRCAVKIHQRNRGIYTRVMRGR